MAAGGGCGVGYGIVETWVMHCEMWSMRCRDLFDALPRRGR